MVQAGKSSFKVTEIDLDGMKKEIGQLEVPKISAREVVAELYDAITSAMSQGVTEKQILEYLKTKDIVLKPTTLKRYLKDGKPGTRMDYGKADDAAKGLSGNSVGASGSVADGSADLSATGGSE